MLIKPKIIHHSIITDNYIIVIENNVMFVTDLKLFHTNTELITSYIYDIVNILDKYKIKYLIFDDRIYDKLQINMQIINFQGLDYFYDITKDRCKNLKLIIHITNMNNSKEYLNRFYDKLFEGRVALLISPDLVSAITTLSMLKYTFTDKVLNIISNPVIRVITSYLLIAAFIFNLIYFSIEQREIMLLIDSVQKLTNKLNEYAPLFHIQSQQY